MLDEALQQALRTALKQSFPDRADAILREVARWFWARRPEELVRLNAIEEAEAQFCSFCRRWYVEIHHFIGVTAAGGHPRFSLEDPWAWGLALAVDETGHPLPSIMLVCNWCLEAYVDRTDEHARTGRWPDPDIVVADIARAIETAKPDEGEALLETLAKRRSIATPRAPEKGACAYCEVPGDVIATDRGHVCPRCILAAREAQKEMLARLQGI